MIIRNFFIFSCFFEKIAVSLHQNFNVDMRKKKFHPFMRFFVICNS